MTTSILVTGGTGTLGRPVAQRLRDTGVTVLSRHPGETAEGIRYTAGDLGTGTGAGVEAAVRGAEVIVHAAGSRTADEQKTPKIYTPAELVNSYLSAVGKRPPLLYRSGSLAGPGWGSHRAGRPAYG